MPDDVDRERRAAVAEAFADNLQGADRLQQDRGVRVSEAVEADAARAVNGDEVVAHVRDAIRQLGRRRVCVFSPSGTAVRRPTNLRDP